MKKFGMGLMLATVVSASVFAQDAQVKSEAKWDGTINKAKLVRYLNLSAEQNDEVADICDYFESQMKRANSSKEKDTQIRNAVYGNLKLMKKTLDEKQYADYVRLMAMTLHNKGIDVEKK